MGWARVHAAVGNGARQGGSEAGGACSAFRLHYGALLTRLLVCDAGVSYGLTQQLFTFWRKAGYQPLYLRQVSRGGGAGFAVTYGSDTNAAAGTVPTHRALIPCISHPVAPLCASSPVYLRMS